jgi:hypothetical protein
LRMSCESNSTEGTIAADVADTTMLLAPAAGHSKAWNAIRTTGVYESEPARNLDLDQKRPGR